MAVTLQLTEVSQKLIYSLDIYVLSSGLSVETNILQPVAPASRSALLAVKRVIGRYITDDSLYNLSNSSSDMPE